MYIDNISLLFSIRCAFQPPDTLERVANCANYKIKLKQSIFVRNVGNILGFDPYSLQLNTENWKKSILGAVHITYNVIPTRTIVPRSCSFSEARSQLPWLIWTSFIAGRPAKPRAGNSLTMHTLFFILPRKHRKILIETVFVNTINSILQNQIKYHVPAKRRTRCFYSAFQASQPHVNQLTTWPGNAS